MHFGRNMQRITNTSVIEDKLGFDQIYIQAKNGIKAGVSADLKYISLRVLCLDRAPLRDCTSLRNSVIKRKNLLQNNY